MDWTLREQMIFLDEAKETTEENRDGKVVEFECPLCAGKAYAKRNGDNIVASCTDCYISQYEKV